MGAVFTCSICGFTFDTKNIDPAKICMCHVAEERKKPLKLKSCPFCGQKKTEKSIEISGSRLNPWKIECCWLVFHGDTEKSVAEHWNYRPLLTDDFE